MQNNLTNLYTELVPKPPEEETPANAVFGQPVPSVWQELKIIFRSMKKSKLYPRILLIVGGTVAILLLNAAGEIRMNQWNGAFFGAVEKKDLTTVGQQSVVFVAIMLVLLAFVVSQNWLLERLKIRLRQWLTNDLLNGWMKPNHAYRLNMISEEKMNPDQRIQEDVRRLCELSCDLGMGALRASLMLISFVGVLWGMSSGILFHLSGKEFEIPGYMVLFAVGYAAIGSFLVIKVGKPLIELNEDRYTREANFRYSVVRVSEHAESISFYSGEKDERKIVNTNFRKVLNNMKISSFANARLTWVSLGHGWMVVILPVLVALPGFLQGKLNFGGLMMVVGAFNQVQQSLRWFVESFRSIADWQAVLRRVILFRETVLKIDESETRKIELRRHEKGYLSFAKTSVSLTDGHIVIADATAEILPGERVLLTGDSGSGKSTLLRAIAGLWPWGSGQIHLPPENEMMFLPQRPYIPLGTLAAAVLYPKTPGQDASHEKIAKCLKRVNLESFIPMLDENARWDKIMSLGQQQRLAFARLLLHEPKWVFLDEATSALDEQNQQNVMSLFTTELTGSTVLSIGHRTGLDTYHTRTLELIETKVGRVLKRKPQAPVTPAQMGTRLQKVWRIPRRIFKRKEKVNLADLNPQKEKLVKVAEEV